MLLFSGSQILCGYIDDTVGIDIECHLDLRDSARSRRDSVETELSQRLVVSRELTLALYHVDVNRGLVICRRREYLALLCRNGGVSLDQPGCHSAHGLDGQGQWGNVQQKDIACAGISCQLAALYGCAEGNTLVRIQRLARLFSGQALYFLLYRRDTGRTAYQQYLAQLGSSDSRIRQRASYRLCRLLYQVMCELVKFCSCQVHIKMLRSFGCCCDERKVDVGSRRGGKLLFRLLCRFLQSLQCHLVVG